MKHGFTPLHHLPSRRTFLADMGMGFTGLALGAGDSSAASGLPGAPGTTATAATAAGGGAATGGGAASDPGSRIAAIISRVVQLPGVQVTGWDQSQLVAVLSSIMDEATIAHIDVIANRKDLSPEAADEAIVKIVVKRLNPGAAAPAPASGGGGAS